MIEEEFEYFKNHQEELYEKFPEQYLVIVNKEVVATANNVADALEMASEKELTPGSFLLQFCGKDEWAYTQVFHSRVKFA